MQVAFALFYHRLRLSTSSRVFLVPLVVKAVIFLRRTQWFQGNGDGKTYKGDNFWLDLED